jgi:hypothetical protein
MQPDCNDNDFLNSLTSLAPDLGIDPNQLSQFDQSISHTDDLMQSSSLDDLGEGNELGLQDFNQPGSENLSATNVEHLNAVNQHPSWVHSDKMVSTGSYYSQTDMPQDYADAATPDGDTGIQDYCYYGEENSAYQSSIERANYQMQDDDNSYFQGFDDHHADVLNSDITVHHRHYWITSPSPDWPNGGDDTNRQPEHPEDSDYADDNSCDFQDAGDSSSSCSDSDI